MGKMTKPSDETINNDVLSKAILIAVDAFQGMVDRSNKPFILHSLRVMMRSEDPDLMTAGVLHDVIEDTDTTFDDLRLAGIPEHIIKIVDAVTQRDDETYRNFVLRTKSSGKKAVRLKLNDLADNKQRLATLPDQGEAEGLRERYEWATHVLTDEWGLDK